MRSEFIKKSGIIQKWLCLCLLVYPVMIQAQQEEKFVSEVKLMNVVEVEITLKNNLYEVRFRDIKKKRFARYKTFHFPDDKKHFFKLKDAVLSGFDSLPEAPHILDFTEEKVEIQFRKSFGVSSFRFVLIQGKKDKRYYSSWLVKGKAEKIFGM